MTDMTAVRCEPVLDWRAWSSLALDRLSKESGYSQEVLTELYRGGSLETHRILLGTDWVGTLVLLEQPPDHGGKLVVFWVEVWPRRALRHRTEDWLVEVTAYLHSLAQRRGCVAVAADVNSARGRWAGRLEAVGFQPARVQLELPVMGAEEETRWAARQQ